MAKKKAKKRIKSVTEEKGIETPQEAVAPPKKARRGRPPVYETEEEFLAMVWEYIEHCKISHEMPNKAGMRFFLRISHDTWSAYRERFPEAHKEAEDYIENQWVQRLAGTTPTGAIFYLKNAFKDDFRDRHETDATIRPASLTKDDIGAAMDKLPKEQQDALYVQLATALAGGAATGSAA
jgi:hypothetical protein